MPRIKYQEIRLSANSLALISTCNQIIREWTLKGHILTLRQLYYQMVSRGLIANEQKEYKRIGSIINDGRLAGLIDWSALEDRTRNVRTVNHWNSPEEIIAAVASQYAIDKWDDQLVRPSIWVEKDALIGIVEQAASELDVECFSCRGYTSQTEMWVAAQRFIKCARDGQETHIIHLGDHDPSGIDMSRDIEDRIRMFMSHHGYGDMLNFTRIALNQNQIDQYQPPPNPAKSSDSRFRGYMDLHGDESWELDALDPDVLSDLIREKVAEIRDDDAYAEKERQESAEKAQLVKVQENWDKVAEFVADK